MEIPAYVIIIIIIIEALIVTRVLAGCINQVE